MERIMIICGGKHQIPLIKKAKEMNLYTICTNLYPDSPCFKFADKTGVFDVLDKEGNLNFAISQDVNAIITDQSEISVQTVAFVSEKMKLPTISTSVANLFTNKYLMREFCKKNNFNYPEYSLCHNIDEALYFYKKNPGKNIMKPVDSFSSRGVYSILTENDIIKNFDKSLEQSPSKHIILENYIPGTEFTIDSLVSEGKVFNLAISEKKHYSYNENIACELQFSYSNPNYDYDLLRNINSSIIAASGLNFGLTHCEYKFFNGKFHLIEMAARGGGVYIASKIVPFLSGVDNYNIYIKSALGYKTSDMHVAIKNKIISNKNKVAKLVFLDIQEHEKKVKEITGIQEILKNKNVLSFECNIKCDEYIPLATSDSTRIGHYIIIGNDYNELLSTEKFIKETFKIIFCNQ